MISIKKAGLALALAAFAAYFSAPALAQLGSAGAGAAAGSAPANCAVLVNSGGSISAGVTATASGGTLCVGSGSYSVGGGMTLSTPITITGYPLQTLCQVGTLGATCPGMPTGTVPTFMPALTETSSALMFSITANNVKIQGLSATGNTPSTNAGACSGAEFSIPQASVTGTVVNQNYLNNFTCAIEGLSSASPFSAQGNYLVNNTYVGLGCSACAGGGSSTWQGNMAAAIGQNSSGTPNAASNDYPFVLSFSGATQSSGFTVQFNTSINSVKWECFDNHDGTNLTWQNNLCVGPGTTTSASDNHNAVTNGISSVAVKNSVIDQGANLTLHDSIDMCALSTCTGASGVSGTNAISGNTILMGSANGCVMTFTSAVTPTNNDGGSPCGTGKNANTVSSITLTSFVDGSTNQFTHGQPNHTIATVNVNMTDASWAWQQPPGAVTLTADSGCGILVQGLTIVQPAAGVTSTGTCTFKLVATMVSMSGSPFTSGTFTLTSN